MENFFNYISKPMTFEDVEIWFNMNNIIFEKMDLYYDFTISLYELIVDTYLGDDVSPSSKIVLSDEDNTNHFNWCWKKTINLFKEENISFNYEGDHYDYFLQFFTEIFYNQKEDRIKNSIGVFFHELFDRKKIFTKSDLDMLQSIYKSLDKNLN